MSLKVLCTAALTTLLLAAPALAQEILLTGPLAGAPTLERRYDWRAQRFELAVTPGASFGSNDRPSLLAGGEVHFFPWNGLGAGAWGTAALPVGSGDTRLRFALSPELVLVPVEGKANALGNAYFRFDLHVMGGAALTWTNGSDERRAWMPAFGVGFRGFSNKFFSNSLDYRLLFGDPVRHLVTLSFSYWPIAPRIEE